MVNEATSESGQKNSTLPYLMQYHFIGKGGFSGINKVPADLRFAKETIGYWNGVYYEKFFQIKSPTLTTSGLWRSKFWHHKIGPFEHLQSDPIKNVYFDIARFTFSYLSADEKILVASYQHRAEPDFFIVLHHVRVTLNILSEEGSDTINLVPGTAWFHYKTSECYGNLPKHLNKSCNLNNPWGVYW